MAGDSFLPLLAELQISHPTKGVRLKIYHQYLRLGPMPYIIRYHENTMGSNPGLNVGIESEFLHM